MADLTALIAQSMPRQQRKPERIDANVRGGITPEDVQRALAQFKVIGGQSQADVDRFTGSPDVIGLSDPNAPQRNRGVQGGVPIGQIGTESAPVISGQTIDEVMRSLTGPPLPPKPPQQIGTRGMLGEPVFEPEETRAITKEIDPIKDKPTIEQEALKYDSAEEYVKAQGKTLYHITYTANVPSIEKNGLRADGFGDVYLSESKNVVDFYPFDYTGDDLTMMEIVVPNDVLAKAKKGEGDSGIEYIFEVGEKGALPVKTTAQLTDIWNKAYGTK